MRHYPVFLDLKDRPVLVVGRRESGAAQDAGTARCRRARDGGRARMAARFRRPARAPRPAPLSRLRSRRRVLVFAATDDRMVNHRIGIAAKGKGMFANIADSAEECEFIVPARVERGERPHRHFHGWHESRALRPTCAANSTMFCDRLRPCSEPCFRLFGRSDAVRRRSELLDEGERAQERHGNSHSRARASHSRSKPSWTKPRTITSSSWSRRSRRRSRRTRSRGWIIGPNQAAALPPRAKLPISRIRRRRWGWITDPMCPGQSSSSTVSIGSKPGYETIYRRQSGAPAAKK